MTAVPPVLSEKLAACAGRLGDLAVAARGSESPPGLSLVLSGGLDGNNSHDFRLLAQAALEAARVGDALILDLAGLTYISSTGVGAFATLLAESHRRKTGLLLRGMRERVKAIFDVLGFSEFFTFIGDQDGGT